MTDIFHTPEFAALHGMDIYIHGGTSIAFGERGGRYKSPVVGTYGGFSHLSSNSDMDGLLAAAIRSTHLPMEVSLPPAFHDPIRHEASINALYRAGFGSSVEETNHHLVVSGAPLHTLMKDSQRKVYFSGSRHGYDSAEYSSLAAAHALLVEDRRRNGHALSMTLEQIVTQERAMGKPRLRVFHTCESMGRQVAAAICFALTEEILYVWAWGTSEKITPSPIPHLASAIHEYAWNHGFTYVDAGISSERGRLNPGLAAFKESMGFKRSPKITMYRDPAGK